MRVFNRWGEVVFQTFNCNIEDASKGWDGMYKTGWLRAPLMYIILSLSVILVKYLPGKAQLPD